MALSTCMTTSSSLRLLRIHHGTRSTSTNNFITSLIRHKTVQQNSCHENNARSFFTTGSNGASNKSNDVIITQTKSTASKDDTTESSSCCSSSSPSDESKRREEEIGHLQTQIRQSYHETDYKTALEHSQTLLEKCTRHFGEEHPATASAHNNIGLMYKLMGEYPSARNSYEDALGVYTRTLGKEHESYAAALHNLASLYRAQALLDEDVSNIDRVQYNELAIEYYEEALQIRNKELGEEHPLTISTRSNLGGVLAGSILDSTRKDQKERVSKLMRKRWDSAENHLRKALTIAVDNPRGPSVEEEDKDDSVDFLEYKNIRTRSAAGAAQNLAVFLKHFADHTSKDDQLYKEAEALYRKALHVRKTLLGDGHPDTIASKFSLAELLDVRGDKDGANVLREEIIALYDVQEMSEDEIKEKLKKD